MSDNDPNDAAAAVDEARLWQRHEDMAQHGLTPRGGVNRQAFSEEDRAARRTMIAWAQALDCTLATDEIGNLYIRRAGRDKKAAPVVTGSHLDSQPTGGKYDGAYGVLAGMEALAAMRDAGIETKRPIEVVAWSNEEGSRFEPGGMGSAVFARDMRLADLLPARDPDGTALGDALARTLEATAEVPHRDSGFLIAAYVEAHIEQGPRLEAAGLPIGVVTGIQGQHNYEITVTGTEAHAGTTPQRDRRDALQSAVAIIAALGDLMHDETDTLRFTVGRMDVQPGSHNTVPGHVAFTIDLRHPDGAELDRRGDAIEGVCQAHVGPCDVVVHRLNAVAPTRFDPKVIETVQHWADALDFSNMLIASGAGHDAMFVAKLCPAGMIFVPCEKGISHNEAEAATPADLAAGARVLTACLVDLANRV